MKRFLSILIISVVGAGALKAQDPEFTQFYANPIYLNPAFAGTAAGPRFALNYRYQWPSVSGAFATYSASYDEHFDGLAGGIGGQVWYDRAGDGRLSTTYVSGVYSYHMTIKDRARDYFIVKAGIQASAFYRSIDFSKLKFGDMIDERRGFIYQTKENLPSTGFDKTGWRPDFSVGVLAFTPKYYAGVAVHHIIEPQQSFFENPYSRIPRKYTLHAGMMLPVDKWKRTPSMYFSPNILIQRQAKFTQFNMGAYMIKDFFMAGAWFRQTDPNSDALMLLIGAKKDAFRIGYSYDITLSDARVAATGSHEISLIIELEKYDQSKKKTWKKIVCPSNWGY